MDKYELSEFGFLRTPAYPITLLNTLYNIEKIPISTKLRNIYQDVSIQAALHAASSKELISEFDKWLKSTIVYDEMQKIERTLINYLVRMTTRCVPFGLFSGFTIAELSGNTSIKLDHRFKNKAHLRLDMEYVQDIIEQINKDEFVRNAVCYYKNTSLYQQNDKYKYVEYAIEKHARNYNYTSINKEEYLEKIINHAESGVTISKMITILTEFDEDISEMEAREYINALIESQVIISEIQPNITGKDILENVIEILYKLTPNSKYLQVLNEIKILLNEKHYTISKSILIKSLVEKLTGPKNYKSILQADLELSTVSNKLNINILQTISDQVQKLGFLAFGFERPELTEFIRQFSKRYDQEEVLLVEALDPETGISYAGLGIDTNIELLENITFAKEKSQDPILIKNNEFIEFIFKKYYECINVKSPKIVLTDEDLLFFEEIKLENILPESFFVHGSIISNSISSLDKGEYRFHLKNLSGPPSTLTFGRFCHCSDLLTEKVIKNIKVEEKFHPDKIYAEIVHLTDARIGNITIRPNLRTYEIPYLGQSGIDKKFQIPITDIVISVRNDKVILRSIKLKKEILPRLTNAHAFSVSRLPIYKFLAEIQRSEGHDWLSWPWQNLRNQNFLPRVEYKNIILSTAKWLITKKDLIKYLPEVTGAVEIISKIRHLYSLPRYLSFNEDLDREYFLDLKSEICCKFIIERIEKHESISLGEYLQDEANCWIHDINESKYTNEVIFSVNKIGSVNSSAHTEVLNNDKQLISDQCKYFVGSEWFYFKIYTGKEFAEKILLDDLHKYIEELNNRNLILKWHFIRYADPEYHLRIRIKSRDTDLCLAEIFNISTKMFKILKNKGIAHKVQIDTYEREISRYGSQTIEESETIFLIDSKACLAIIKLLEEFEELNERWLWAMGAIDSMFEIFNLDLEERQNLISKLEKFQFQKSNGDKQTLKDMNAKYKLHEKEIQSFLIYEIINNRSTKLYSHIFEILSIRKNEMKKVAESITMKLQIYGELKLNDLLASYLHIMINRLFTSLPNKCELVIYSLLNRYYLYKLNKK